MVTLRSNKTQTKDEATIVGAKKSKNSSVAKTVIKKKPPGKDSRRADSSVDKSSVKPSSRAAPTTVPNQENKEQEGCVLQEFLSTRVDDETKHEAIQWLYDTIRKAAPNLKPELQGKATLAFGGFDYETKSKCSGRWSLIGIMVNKTGLSLMVSGMKDGKYLLEHYDKKKIGKGVSLGKSCIRFPKLDNINKHVLEEIIAEAAVADVSPYMVS